MILSLLLTFATLNPDQLLARGYKIGNDQGRIISGGRKSVDALDRVVQALIDKDEKEQPERDRIHRELMQKWDRQDAENSDWIRRESLRFEVKP